MGRLSAYADKARYSVQQLVNLEGKQVPYKVYEDAVSSVERLYTCMREEMPFRAQPPEEEPAGYMPEDAKDGQDEIKAVCRDGIYEFTLPVLLPKRNKRGHTLQALTMLITPKVKQLHEEEGRPRLEKGILCYEFVTDGTSGRRDYDNTETKTVTDIITRLFLHDDSPEYLYVYYFSTKGKPSCTKVYLMPPERFIGFLEEKDERVHPSG